MAYDSRGGSSALSRDSEKADDGQATNGRVERFARWTAALDAELTERWHRGESLVTIGAAVGRSPLSVAARAHRLGLPPRERTSDRLYRRWTPREDEMLTGMWPHHTLEEIAARVDRTADAVLARGRALGLGPAPAAGDMIGGSTMTVVPTISRPAAGNQPGTRKCLKCGGQFWSRGKGHRVCDSCKQTEDWRFGSYSSDYNFS